MSEAAGFAAHLTKPVEFQTLEAAMRRVVSADRTTPRAAA